MAIQHGMNGAGGRDFDGMRQAPEEAIANLARTPVGLFFLRRQNGGFDRFRQLIGISEWTSCPIRQPFQTALLIPLENLVAGFPRDAKLAAEGSHRFAVLEPDHETHSLVHNRTLLPWHGLLPPLGDKV